MIFVSVWLSTIISRSIHTASDDIIWFFLWFSNIPLYIRTLIKKHRLECGGPGVPAPHSRLTSQLQL